MWRCTRCGEEVEETFDLCWNCGSDREGNPSENFRREPELPEPEANSTDDAAHGKLTRREIAELVCKGMALWLFTQVSLELGTIVFFLLGITIRGYGTDDDASAPMRAWFAAVPVVVQILVGAVLWINSATIARRMVRNDPTPVLHTGMDAQQWLAIGMTVLGVFLFVAHLTAVIKIAAHLSWYVDHRGMPILDFWGDVRMQAGLWSAALGLALGAWLALGSRGIIRVLGMLRRPDPADESAEGA